MKQTKHSGNFVLGFLAGGITCAVLGAILYGMTEFSESYVSNQAMTVPTSMPLGHPSSIPGPTATRRPIPTKTPMPSIGSPVTCGNYWIIEILEPPEFMDSSPRYDLKALGTWLVLRIAVTNITRETGYFLGAHMSVAGELNGSRLSFSPDARASNDLAITYKLNEPTIEIPPSLQTAVIAAFDVNPNASNWEFMYSEPEIAYQQHKSCEVRFSLEP